MGWTPNQVDEMTLYQFISAAVRYARIQSGKPDPMSDAEFEAGLARLRELGHNV